MTPLLKALQAQRNQAMDAAALLAADLDEARAQIASLIEQLKEAKKPKKKETPPAA